MKKQILFFLTFIALNTLTFASEGINSEFGNDIYSFPKLYEKTIKATVAIKVYYDSSLDDSIGALSRLWYGDYCEPKALGSGFIFTDDGYIFTNHHVVNEGNYYEVYFSDETHTEAELIGADERSDIAILKVDMTNLFHLNLESNDVSIGEWVYVVGNPLSIKLKNSLSVGLVAGKNRYLGLDDIENDIQLDINVNSGNSGSPALNLNGNVIGMVKSAVNSDIGSGIAFIIPNSTLNKISKQLIKNGKIFFGRFGFKEITQTKDDLFLISKITDKSPAAKAGLKKDDEILEYDGILMTSLDAFESYVKLMEIGEVLHLKIKRGNEILFFNLKKEKV